MYEYVHTQIPGLLEDDEAIGDGLWVCGVGWGGR